MGGRDSPVLIIVLVVSSSMLFVTPFFGPMDHSVLYSFVSLFSLVCFSLSFLLVASPLYLIGQRLLTGLVNSTELLRPTATNLLLTTPNAPYNPTVMPNYCALDPALLTLLPKQAIANFFWKACPQHLLICML